jgi:hypothetical protein
VTYLRSLIVTTGAGPTRGSQANPTAEVGQLLLRGGFTPFVDGGAHGTLTAIVTNKERGPP